MKDGRSKKVRWIVAVAGLTVLILATVLWTGKEIRDFGEVRSTKSADAAIVLGAAVANSRPTPVFQGRIDHALRLYRQGRVEKILFTGGVGAGDSVAESEAAKRYAIANGVPEGDLLLEKRSKTTYENLLFASRLGHEQGLRTFLIVSDPLHMRRAMDMAADLGMTAEPSPTDSSRYRTTKSRGRFLRREIYDLLEYRLYERYARPRPSSLAE